MKSLNRAWLVTVPRRAWKPTYRRTTRVVAPRGTIVYGRLGQASSAGRMSGSSQLTDQGQGRGQENSRKNSRRCRIGRADRRNCRKRNRGCYWRARGRCGWYRDCRLQEGRAVTNPERIFARVPAGEACGAPSGGIVWSDSAALRCGRSVRRDVLPLKPIV
jgi:hypothetical protein